MKGAPKEAQLVGSHRSDGAKYIVIVTFDVRRQLVGPSFPAGAPPLAAVQYPNAAYRCCQQVGKPQLGSCGLLTLLLLLIWRHRDDG